ncbi:MAG: D-glycero-beta-D-manno-heptose 1-phosphate adenylyltransferase [Candidatus Gastranaerophilales bacterium]|nr:D-glycero-beta-D-manno-heptose 1-phosphate adenylyltransferase [Candidatus Gastranaerophilales bacterium]
MGQVIDRKNLNDAVLTEKASNKKIVSTNGCFDILHVGHVRYLQESKKQGDVLIVCLNSDSSVKRLKGENRPVNNEADRAEVLAALGCVDYVVIFDEDTPCNLIEIIKPDVHTKGGDYNPDNLPETKVITENGGKLVFINFVEGKSTTSTIEKMKLC